MDGALRSISHFLEQRLLIDDLKTSDHFEGRASTGSGLFALLSNDFEQIFGQIVSITEKTLSVQIWKRQGILKENKVHFRFPSVAQRRRCL